MKNSMCSAFYFTTTANVCGVFLIFFYEIWKPMRLYFIMFWATLSLVALGLEFYLYGFIYIYIYFLLLNGIKEGSFYYHTLCDSPPSILKKMFMNCFLFCEKNNKVSFFNSFASKKIHISYFFSVFKSYNNDL